MNLYEFEGKQLFKDYNIDIPNGFLYNNESSINFPVIAKSQVLTGGRGLAGGIKKVENKKDFEKTISNLSSLTINNEKTKYIYIEEIINFTQEKYLSLFTDRNSKSVLLIASNSGGVDIEKVPPEEILTFKVNIIHGIQTYMIKHLSDFLSIEVQTISALLSSLWNLYIENNAELIEINPLFVLEDNTVIAGDSKVTLDDTVKIDNIHMLERNQDSFEEKCKSVFASGTKLNGNIAIVASGAGLGMATLDIVKHSNLEANCLVDLQGHVIHNLEDAKKLITFVKELKPELIFFNYYFQLASCLTLSKAISAELGNSDIKVYLRMKGRDEKMSKKELEKFSNIFIDDDLVRISEKLVEENL